MIIITQDQVLLNSNFVALYNVYEATHSEELDPQHQDFGEDHQTLQNAGFEFHHTSQWNKNRYIRKFYRFNAVMSGDTEAIYEGDKAHCEKLRETLIAYFARCEPTFNVGALIASWGFQPLPDYTLLRDKPLKSDVGDDDTPF